MHPFILRYVFAWWLFKKQGGKKKKISNTVQVALQTLMYSEWNDGIAN